MFENSRAFSGNIGRFKWLGAGMSLQPPLDIGTNSKPLNALFVSNKSALWRGWKK
jgi:hypothetical protein